MKRIFFMILLGATWGVHAEVVFPAHCKTVEVKDKTFTLSASKPSLVLMNNFSNNDIWITHPVTEPSASAGWSTRLQAGKWSALSLQEKAFELSCIESQPGHEQQVPCASVLTICQWTNITLPPDVAGTFWAGEDMGLSALITYVERRGFVLPVSSQ